MVWRIEFKDSARKSILKLDKSTQTRILNFLSQRVQSSENPRFSGKALQGNLKKLWRYRVGDYRLVCDIQDETITITVIKLGHQKDIYRQ
ncbi:type II toxin-antitoxin system RelE family toxin [Candidatus Venteria ishoeyi]|uniref:Toxin RelG n=1 Tax=Candidatus Venteria ishoeyi TaxID=1899563 RepID=A0A1H6FG02_9GAMM|nr:type II toxin-antitoxin system RelE/ParE family toxin [Candidatus Venteria ishoeyi]SEH08341.1 Toxin RelG [Candidatus Venteria ishoeyi]